MFERLKAWLLRAQPPAPPQGGGSGPAGGTVPEAGSTLDPDDADAADDGGPGEGAAGDGGAGDGGGGDGGD